MYIFPLRLLIVVHVIRVHSAIGSTGNDNILLWIDDEICDFVPQLQYFFTLDALLLALLGDLEAEDVSLGVEVPSGRSASEGHH